MADPDGDGMTIDELATRAGLPVRTIRYYQSRRLLPAPERRGRAAFYTDSHLDRLEEVAGLRSRGLSLDVISDALSQADAQLTVNEWLGLRSANGSSDAEPRRWIDDEELTSVLGADSAEWAEEFERVGIISRDSAGWLIHAPLVFQLASELARTGVPVTAVIPVEQRLRDDLARLARETLRSTVTLGDAAPDIEALTSAVDTIAAAGAEAVSVLFRMEFEHAIADLVDEVRGQDS